MKLSLVVKALKNYEASSELIEEAITQFKIAPEWGRNHFLEALAQNEIAPPEPIRQSINIHLNSRPQGLFSVEKYQRIFRKPKID